MRMRPSKRCLAEGVTLVLACLVVPVASVGQAKTSAPKPSQATTCLGRPNTDANLDAIVNEVFKRKAPELLQEKIVSREFYESVRDAQYEICDDRTWDAVAFPRTPPFVAFDSFLLTFLAMQSESLILGQYLANDHPQIGPLDLHTALMRYVIAQNLKKDTLTIHFQDLVNQVMGAPTDISKYESNGKFPKEVQTMFLTSLYFLIFHEFCHIHSNDPQQRLKIAAMPEKEANNTAKQAMLVRLEINADACAIDIMNRDEAQFKFSPSPSLVLSWSLPPRRSLRKYCPPRDRPIILHPKSASPTRMRRISDSSSNHRTGPSTRPLWRAFISISGASCRSKNFRKVRADNFAGTTSEPGLGVIRPS